MDAHRRHTWNERHRVAGAPGAPSRFVIDALDALALSAPLITGGPALDLACGRGRHALLLADRGHRVDAIDYSLPALTALRRHASASGLDVRCAAADVTQWRMPVAHYAVVVVVGFLDRTLFAALRAAVVPGGALVYEAELRTGDGETTIRADFCLAPGELESLAHGWEIVLRRDEPTTHRGRACVRAGIAARRPPSPH